MGALLLVEAARKVSERRKSVDAALRTLESATRRNEGVTFRELVAAREALADLGVELCGLERALRAAESGAPPARLRIVLGGAPGFESFVEVEECSTGRSVRLGERKEGPRGLDYLEFTASDVERAAAEVQ